MSVIPQVSGKPTVVKVQLWLLSGLLLDCKMLLLSWRLPSYLSSVGGSGALNGGIGSLASGGLETVDGPLVDLIHGGQRSEPGFGLPEVKVSAPCFRTWRLPRPRPQLYLESPGLLVGQFMLLPFLLSLLMVTLEVHCQTLGQVQCLNPLCSPDTPCLHAQAFPSGPRTRSEGRAQSDSA